MLIQAWHRKMRKLLLKMSRWLDAGGPGDGYYNLLNLMKFALLFAHQSFPFMEVAIYLFVVRDFSARTLGTSDVLQSRINAYD